MGVIAPRLRLSLCVALIAALLPAAHAEPPAAVLDVLRDMARGLASQDGDLFFNAFDRNTQGYAELRGNVGKLIAVDGVASTIEPVTNTGDGERQQLQLDWLLRTSRGESRRQLVKCTLERRGKNWKIVSLEPVSFFRFD